MPNKPVIRIDPTGTETRYPSVKAAAEAIGTDIGQVSKACLFGNLCHGYYFRKAGEA